MAKKGKSKGHPMVDPSCDFAVEDAEPVAAEPVRLSRSRRHHPVSEPGPTARQLIAAVRALNHDARQALYRQTFGRAPSLAANSAAVSRAVGRALEGKPIPAELVLTAAKPARVAKIRAVFRALSARPEGVSLPELRAAMAEQGVDLQKVEVAKTDGSLKHHVVSPTKRAGWSVRVEGERIYAQPPAAKS